jgi:2-iminoacetate synthase ThiH
VRRAAGTPVTAFSMATIEREHASSAALVGYLRCLASEGLAAIAEVPLDLLGDARQSLEALTSAGIPAARFTVERPIPDDPATSLLEIRHLQKITGAVRVFAPLPRAATAAGPSTGYDDVKLVALSRLVLDNVPSIQVDWSLYGPKLAQVALLFGADDVDGVSPLEETGEGRRRAPLEEIRRNIRAASQTPVERDGRFAVRE